MDRFGGYDQGYDRTFGPSGGYPYPQNQPVSEYLEAPVFLFIIF